MTCWRCPRFVLDGGWAQTAGKAANGSSCKACSLQQLDRFGRPAPSDAYPSALRPPQAHSVEQRSLRPVVSAVNKLGLKMGVWHIRGAHAAAVKAKLPVATCSAAGVCTPSQYTMDQIVMQEPCPVGCQVIDRALVGFAPHELPIGTFFTKENDPAADVFVLFCKQGVGRE